MLTHLAIIFVEMEASKLHTNSTAICKTTISVSFRHENAIATGLNSIHCFVTPSQNLTYITILLHICTASFSFRITLVSHATTLLRPFTMTFCIVWMLTTSDGCRQAVTHNEVNARRRGAVWSRIR